MLLSSVAWCYQSEPLPGSHCKHCSSNASSRTDATPKVVPQRVLAADIRLLLLLQPRTLHLLPLLVQQQLLLLLLLCEGDAAAAIATCHVGVCHA